MDWKPALRFLGASLAFTYGLLTYISYGVIAVFKGSYFRQPTEKENLELQLAKDRFWNLSKDWAGLSHHLLTLKNGFKFHYVSNHAPNPDEKPESDKPLVIFLHGFPDSWAIWRHVLVSSTLRERSTMIAFDLPGYGGTDSLSRYGATEVLEALTEFIVTIREQYGVESGNSGKATRKVYIVAHDWGAVLAFRLAAEAPQLADRFIMTNGPLIPLVRSNVLLTLESAKKMFKTFERAPLCSWSVLWKSICALKPVFRQLLSSSYIFVFHLPIPLVRKLGHSGNYSFLKEVHRMAAGNQKEYTVRDAQESMASSVGPSELECQTSTDPGAEKYGDSVCKRQKEGNFVDTTSYYRHGASDKTWHKSLETISSLHAIWPDEPRRTSSGTALFDPPAGSLRTNATILWGTLDPALDAHMNLEGMADYLVQGSQVIILPRTAHFLPMEAEGRAALEEILKWAIEGEQRDLGAAVGSAYRDAAVVVNK